MADGKVVIDVLLDDGQVVKGVADISKQLGGIEGAAQKGALGIGKIVAALGLVVAAKAGIDMIKTAIGGAFARIDTMERFERVMTTMTGSTEKAKAALEAARSTVKGTAYGLDVAAKSVQDFVTRGMEVDKATSTFEAWGDAVAFYGDGSNAQLATVMDALAKMTTSGKVGMDQMNRLFDAGIDGVGMYAKAVGRDAESVQKDLSSGKISAEDFIDVVTKAMMEGTNGVQKIAGSAKEAGASWTGTFDNMQAAVNRGVVNIIQTIDEMLTSNGLPNMREMIANFGKKFEEVLNKVATAIPPIVDKIIAIKNALDPWMPLIMAVATAVGVMVLAWAAFNSAKKTIDNVKTSFAALKTVMAANPWLLAIGAIIALAVLIYMHWDEIKEYTINAWTAIKDFFSGLWDSIKQIASDAWNGFVEMLSGVWDSIAGTATNAWETIVSVVMAIIQPFVDGVLNVYNNMKDGLTLILEGLKQYFEGVWELIKNIFLGAVLLIVDLVTGDFEGLKNHSKQIFENIKSALNDIWVGIKKIFSGAVSAALGYVKGAWENIKSTTSTVFSTVKNLLSTVWENIKTIISTKASAIWSTVKQKFEDIKNAIRDKMNNAKSSITGIWNNVMSFFRGINLKTIGQNIIQGLINGIKSKVSAVTNAVKDVTSAITGKIKNILGIKSPSRWMRDMIGKNMMLGWQGGIEKEKRSSKKMAAKATSWMTPDMPVVSGFVNKLRGMSAPVGNVMPVSAVVGASGAASSSGSQSGRGYVELEPQQLLIQAVMDGKVVGELVAPHVDTKLFKIRTSKMRGRG